MSSASQGLAPREGLECLLVKMGRTGPLAEPRRGPQAGKSGVPHSQNADSGWGHNRLLVIWLQGCLRETNFILRLPRIDKP